MTTPFAKNGEINYALVAPQVEWMIGAGPISRPRF
jgi:4-hydroxy-tetrahydrodipicolinate synthase